MEGQKLTIGEIQRATFAGNSTITLVRPARTTKVVKDGAETTIEVPATRYTFKVVRAKGEDADRPWFVKVMFGSDNESDYTFLGTVFTSEQGLVLRASAKGLSATDKRFVAFNWLVERLAEISRVELKSFERKLAGELFDAAELSDELAGPVHELARVEVWFEGSCCKCGRKLTVPSSIARFLGPECAKKLALKATGSL